MQTIDALMTMTVVLIPAIADVDHAVLLATVANGCSFEIVKNQQFLSEDLNKGDVV